MQKPCEPFFEILVLIAHESIQGSDETEHLYSLTRALAAGTHQVGVPGRVAQSVTCLVTDVSLTADPGVASLIPARSHTFKEIDHETVSTVILLPSAEAFKKGFCQLQAKVCARSTR